MEAITATYAQEDADWTITVAGQGKELSARAPGIIAARDRADQLVEKVSPEQNGRTVVHLLNGSALDFTAAYMQARLARSVPPAATGEGAASDGTPAKRSAEGKKPTATKAKRTSAPAERATKTRTASGKSTHSGTQDDTPGDVGTRLSSAQVPT